MTGIAKVHFTSSKYVKKERLVSEDNIISLVKNMESKTGIEIFGIIKNILKCGKADSVSIRNDRPRSLLYIRNNAKDVSISFEGSDKEIKVSIPKDSVDSYLSGRV